MSAGLQRLEGQSVDDIWEIYAAERLPPAEIAVSYTHAQVREAFVSAFWAALTIEHLTRHQKRRALIFNRWRRDSMNLLRRVFHQF